jgi:uncharacterized protein (TIGR02453 family)
MIFKGFVPESFKFLADLAENNNRPWFADHKKEYEKLIKEPLNSLAQSLNDFMLGIDPAIDVTPSHVVTRINRDTRFAQDKSPYKTNLWLSYVNRTWSDAPGFYFEIGIDFYGFGMGFYKVSRETMDKFRSRICDSPKEFLDTVKFLHDGELELIAEKYKKPVGVGPHAIEEWLYYKTFYVAYRKRDTSALIRPDLVDVIKGHFRTVSKLYNYLMDLRCEG